MTHAHVHGDVDVPPVIGRRITVISIALAVAAVIGIVMLRPGSLEGIASVAAVGPQYDARVVSSDLLTCPGQTEVEEGVRGFCWIIRFRLLAGPDTGEQTTLVLPADSPTTPELNPGDVVVLAYEEDAEPEFRYAFLDRQRKLVLWWLAVVFALAVVLLGRLRGFAALVGLVLTIVILLQFVLPAILTGRSPVLVAIFGSAAIAYATLYLAHGFKLMTTVALLGTLSALALTAVLAQVFVVLAKLSGFASEESVLVQLAATQLDARGLVLAGVVIGALGALDDVTVTQASAVWELKVANPGMRARELYRSGLRIGRDHIASTVNTLLLAYAGASMPLLLFFVISQQSLGTVANEEVVATEIVRTLVGSIGLVTSVPITTWLAARIATMRDRREVTSG